MRRDTISPHMSERHISPHPTSMCPHTTIYVSPYNYICVRILLHMCHDTRTYSKRTKAVGRRIRVLENRMMKIGVANERLAQVLEHLELRGLDEPDMRGIHVFAELDKLELEARAQVPTSASYSLALALSL